MYKNLKTYIISGIIFTILLGTLFHFIYKWSNNNPIIGLFSPVNESVWEHLKLLFYPITLWVIGGYFKFGQKNNKNYIFSSLTGLIAGLLFIPTVFYTYISFLKKPYFVIDILIFVLGVIISFFTMGYIYKNFNIRHLSTKLLLLIWEFIFILFVIFTIFPPNISIFKSL